MKKYFIISFCALFLIASLIISVSIFKKNPDKETQDFFSAADNVQNSDNKTVIAIVEDSEIYQENIDMVKASETLSNKHAKEYAEKNGIDSPQSTPRTDEEILNELIQNKVIYQQAEREGLLPDYKEAYSLAEENYNLIIEADDENTEFIKKYMETLGLDKDGYIEGSAQANFALMAQNNLYKKFIEGKSGTAEELKAQFEEYVDTLVENADIQYK